jgi:hypothetical protein
MNKPFKTKTQACTELKIFKKFLKIINTNIYYKG